MNFNMWVPLFVAGPSWPASGHRPSSPVAGHLPMALAGYPGWRYGLSRAGSVGRVCRRSPGRRGAAAGTAACLSPIDCPVSIVRGGESGPIRNALWVPWRSRRS